MTNRRFVRASLLVSAALLATACSGATSPSSGSPVISKSPGEGGKTVVVVAVKEWSVAPSPATVKAGEINFQVQNSGTIVHEFVVVKTDADPAKLPTYGAGDKPAEGHASGDVDEDKVESVGEVEDIAAGSTKDATFRLAAGKYALMCNLAGHYAAGMRVSFTVQ